ncbi:MAG: quinolinate synthase NadA, partial [Peptostreptococcus anaerobius]
MTESGVNILGDSKALVTEIERLKKEKDVLILAHYYTRGEVQEIADVVGDSFQLAKMAQEST